MVAVYQTRNVHACRWRILVLLCGSTACFMTKSNSELSEPEDVLFRIKRGLAGYISYLAACEMNQAFSEYVLYEPILRILTARNYTVFCEYPRALLSAAIGDSKRVDFFARGDGARFVLEVKWAKNDMLYYQHHFMAKLRQKGIVKKNPAAVALSKLGASKGGIARAKSLSASARARIARLAAAARWSVPKEGR